jgi:tetratricopeptide (TPR) repeat protein
MRTISFFLFLLIAACASAQDAKRVEAIWAAANDRLTLQNDVWFEDGEFPMVVQLLRFQVELDPHDYETVTNLGWMLENIHEWDEAVVVYRDYKRNNPNDPDAALPEANYWFIKRQFAKIPPLLSKVSSKAHPNNFRILAHAFERTGKLKEAERVWKRYLALHPNDEAAKVNLARVKRKLGTAGQT